MGKNAIAFFAVAALFSLPARGDIVVGGNRPVTVHVPPTYDPEIPTPLIILLHGYGGDGPQIDAVFNMRSLADSLGVLYAAPNGTPDQCGVRFWNATDACCKVVCGAADIDDVGYLRGLVEEIRSQLNVDPRRIYFTGWSNGGFMSYRMACEHPEMVAAIASIAGAAFRDPSACTPGTPVHVLQVHGTADDVIFYAGGGISGVAYPGAVGTVERWAQYNGCSLEPEDGGAMDQCSSFPGEETQVTRYTDQCRAAGSAELWSVPGAGHAVCLGDPSFAERVVGFLLSHPKKPIPEASFSIEPGGGTAPLEVTVDGSASTTPEGTAITLYRWNFGDGTSKETTAPVASHTLTQPGRSLITLTIETDDEGRAARATRPVGVFCPPGDITPWTAADIGGPLFRGSAWFAAGGGGGELRLCAGGNRLGLGGDDQCFSVFREFRGDFVFTVHLSDLKSDGVGDEIGLMLRESPAAGSRFVAMVFKSSRLAPTPQGRFILRSRAAPGQGAVSRLGGQVNTLDVWLKLERRGEVFRGSSSLDGETWTPIPERQLSGFPETLLGGAVAVATDVPEPSGAVSAFEPLEVGLSSLQAVAIIPEIRYRRGRVNADALLDLSDAVFILGHLFLGDPLGCRKSADFNDDGSLDISDAVSLLSHLFLGEPDTPGEPFAACGVDPTPDELGCTSPPDCG